MGIVLNPTRHKLAEEPLNNIAVPLLAVFWFAESLENAGNWYLAGRNTVTPPSK
jgi:hypothetical protein